MTVGVSSQPRLGRFSDVDEFIAWSGFLGAWLLVVVMLLGSAVNTVVRLRRTRAMLGRIEPRPA